MAVQCCCPVSFLNNLRTPGVETCSKISALQLSTAPCCTIARPYGPRGSKASTNLRGKKLITHLNSVAPRERQPGAERFLHCGMSTPPMANVSESKSDTVDSAPRRRMMETIPYTPPVWAESLTLIPKDTFCLGQRDDLSGLQLSGNKVRKLEFLLADAKRCGADCVITVGGIQSNHCRATAVAARYAGMDSYLILRTNKSLVSQDPGLVGNLLVERMVGAHCQLVSKEDYRALGAEKLGAILKSKLEGLGRKPYFIPVGGSNALGSWGYIEAVREIERQVSDGSTAVSGPLDDIVVACGSFGVCDDPDYFYDYVQGLIDGIGEGFSSRDLATMWEAKGVGYAMSTSEELSFVRHVALSTGIVLDPVYSGKALKALLDSMASSPSDWEGRRVLFIHTGGLLGMFDKIGQLQPLMDRWQTLDLSEDVVAQGDGTGKML